MKHIKKRFLIETEENKLNQDIFTVKDVKEGLRDTDIEKKNIAFLITTIERKAIGGFPHKVGGKNYIFPIPDPTLIYFHNAQQNIKRIKEYKKELLKKLDFNQELTESAINEIYGFYGATAGFVIYLFTSMESYINQLIPDDFIYSNSTTKTTELYNKNQIQEFLDFKTKATKVLKEVTGKNFFEKPTQSNEMIWNLKNFRDAIIHTKQGKTILRYDNLIKTSLNFKYDEALISVAKFMNFYKPNYIIECDCGENF